MSTKMNPMVKASPLKLLAPRVAITDGDALVQLPYVIRTNQGGMSKQWLTAHYKSKKQRMQCAVALGPMLRDTLMFRGLPATVIMERCCTRLVDHANLGGIMKPFEDGMFDVFFAKCQAHKVRPCGHKHDGPSSPVKVAFTQSRGDAYGLRFWMHWAETI